MWPNDTQPHGYQIMLDRQITHHTQPNGYQMFDGQTHSQIMVIECLPGKNQQQMEIPGFTEFSNLGLA